MRPAAHRPTRQQELFLFDGLIVVGAFAAPGGAADFGWTAYAPLSDGQHSPGIGNLWTAGLIVSGLGTIRSGVNGGPAARTRYDDVAKADSLLEHHGHQPPGVPGPHPR